MKPREPRRKVMIKARMRAGASWSDALILNLSSRGMLVRSDQAPTRGSYLEIRRGQHVMVARVVWSGGGRFGVRTQDPVPAEELIHDPEGAAAPAATETKGFKERRAAPRLQDRHEASRHMARIGQFVLFAFVSGVGALLIGGAVMETVARPLAAAQLALAGK